VQIPSHISIGSAVFAQLMVECRRGHKTLINSMECRKFSNEAVILLMTDELANSAYECGCSGPVGGRLGHAFGIRHQPSSDARRSQSRRQRHRLRPALHRVGVGRPHHQSVGHVDVRVCAHAQRTQARHRVPAVPRLPRGVRQLGQHDPVSDVASPQTPTSKSQIPLR